MDEILRYMRKYVVGGTEFQIQGCLSSHSVMSDSLWPHGLKPTRLPCPWDFPGKNTGVGYHFLLQGSHPPRGWTCISCIANGFFTTEPPLYFLDHITLLSFFVDIINFPPLLKNVQSILEREFARKFALESVWIYHHFWKKLLLRIHSPHTNTGTSLCVKANTFKKI